MAPPFAAQAPALASELDPGPDRLFGRALKLDVDGQAHGVAGLWELARGRGARHLVERVDPDLPDPGLAAQIGVVGPLDPALADLVAARVPLAEPRELPLVDLTDVAEHVARERALLVTAKLGRGHLDPGEVVLVLADVARLVVVDVGLDHDRRERVVAEGSDLAADVPGRNVQELRQLHDHLVEAAVRVRGPELNDRAGDVRDEHDAVSVHDRATRRLDAIGADLVVPGRLEVLIAGDDLERPEPEEEEREEDDGDDAEDGDAGGRPRRQAVRLLDPWVAREEAPARGRPFRQRPAPSRDEAPAGRACARPSTWGSRAPG